MNEEQDLKLTDLDYLIGNHHLQMMKAALPYLNVPEQKVVSILVKLNELHRTIDLFQNEEVAAMGICSLDKSSNSPLDMLSAMKAYANTYEQDMIDLISNFLQGARLSNAYQESVSQTSAGENDGDSSKGPFGNLFRRMPIEQLKNILSPEQQSKLDTIQLLMQAMQQMA